VFRGPLVGFDRRIDGFEPRFAQELLGRLGVLAAEPVHRGVLLARLELPLEDDRPVDDVPKLRAVLGVKPDVLGGDVVRHRIDQPDGDRPVAVGPNREGDRGDREIVRIERLLDRDAVAGYPHDFFGIGVRHTR
jgi:hypothetical protein